MARDFVRHGTRPIVPLGALIVAFIVGAARADEKSVPEQIVDTMNKLFGKHPGFRSAHAKGIVCEGEFTPAPSAASLSKAPHLQSKPVRVTIRFSKAVDAADLARLGTVVSADAAQAVLSVPATQASTVVRDALATLPIVDLAIEEPPLEEVMRELFHAGARESPERKGASREGELASPERIAGGSEPSQGSESKQA